MTAAIIVATVAAAGFIAQSIRIAFLRDELAERDAMIARYRNQRTVCVFPECVATCERRAA